MIDPIQAFMQANSLLASPFPPESRYHGIAVVQATQPDGTSIAYLKRRFVPAPENFSVLQVHKISQGDRLDNLAAHYIGDPTQYWRICDANGGIRPAELTETVGKTLNITMPEGIPGVFDAG